MKTKILCFISVVTCLAFTVSPMCCGAIGEIEAAEIIAETIYQQVLSGDSIENNPYAELNKNVAELAWNYMLQKATLRNNEIELKFPTWDVITGKCTNEVTFMDGGKYSYTVDVSGVFCEAEMASLWNYASESTGGQQVYANCLNITITKPSGVTQYVIEMPSTWSYASKYSASTTGVTININTYCKLYGYSNGKRILMDTNFYVNSVLFSTVTVNSVVNNTNLYSPPPNNYQQNPVGIYSAQGSAVSSSGALRYPLDVDILHNTYQLKYNHTTNTSSTGVVFRPMQHLYISYITTNSSTRGNMMNTNWTDNSKQNYYIYPVTGGTTINNTNYNDYSGGLAPVFSLDTSLPDVLDILKDIIPAILDLITPDIDMDIGDLLGKLLDFFGHMPDIDMPWDVDPSLNLNNYNDLQLPDINLPDTGGGGSGGDIKVNVDITRPKIPEVNTEPHVSIYYPTVTTTAIPQSVLSAAKDFVDVGKDITDMCGTTNIIVVCGLIGIGVMLIFKDW